MGMIHQRLFGVTHLTDPLEPGHELVASLVHGVRDVVRQPRHLHSVQYSVQYCVQYSTVQPRHLVHGLEDVEDGLLLPQVGQHQRNLELGEVVLLSGRRRGVM